MNDRHRTIERVKHSRSYKLGIILYDIKLKIEETVKKSKYDWAKDPETAKKELVDMLCYTFPRKSKRVEITIDLNKKGEDACATENVTD